MFRISIHLCVKCLCLLRSSGNWPFYLIHIPIRVRVYMNPKNNENEKDPTLQRTIDNVSNHNDNTETYVLYIVIINKSSVSWTNCLYANREIRTIHRSQRIEPLTRRAEKWTFHFQLNTNERYQSMSSGFFFVWFEQKMKRNSAVTTQLIVIQSIQ